jgi:hypothetical protein
MGKLLIGAVVALSLVGPAWAEEDVHSANFLLPGCRENLQPNPNNTDRVVIWKRGLCSGIMTGLALDAGVSKKMFNQAVFCPPQKATNEQFIRVVVAYIDKHPEMMHQPFESLALFALMEAWPCQ